MYIGHVLHWWNENLKGRNKETRQGAKRINELKNKY
jgi:hypothetical protein